MNKPLKDWTLGEIYEECTSHGEGCKLNGVCPFVMSNVLSSCRIRIVTGYHFPSSWDLSEPPRWTEQEKEEAKQIRRLLPWAENICRTDTGNLLINSCVYEIYPGLIIYEGFFPSLKPGESVTLDEIIGGAE